MKTLQISSIPMMELAQEAYENLVTNLTIELPFVNNADERNQLLVKRQAAVDMVNHIREVITENQSDSSNPKS